MENALTDQDINYAKSILEKIQSEFSSNIVGQENIYRGLIIGLLTGGHVLLEGVPGLAKTRSIKTIADTIHAKFSRIQFTPDLLPSDVTGNQIFNPKDAVYSIKKGPVFANILLADEINRAPAKVQSSLLEAMQEKQVTIGGETLDLPHPFLVLATQNPIEQEGTYGLPEAQVDRFLIKTVVNYPNIEDEFKILNMMEERTQIQIKEKVTLEEIEKIQELIKQIHIDEKVKRYITNIIQATRFPENYGKQNLKSLLSFGASPRGTIAFLQTSKVMALLAGRNYVIPDDIKAMRYEVLRHRLILTYEAQADNIPVEQIIDEIFNAVSVP